MTGRTESTERDDILTAAELYFSLTITGLEIINNVSKICHMVSWCVFKNAWLFVYFKPLFVTPNLNNESHKCQLYAVLYTVHYCTVLQQQAVQSTAPRCYNVT